MGIKYRRDVYLSLLLFIIITFFWSAITEDTRVASLFWLGLIMLIFPLFTLLRGWYGLKVKRTIPNVRYYTGDRIEIRLQVENLIFLPVLLLKVIDEQPKRHLIKNGKSEDLDKSINYLRKGTVSLSYYLHNVPRGKLKWGKITIFRTDLLGFVSITKDLEHEQELIIYPRYVKVNPARLLNTNDDNEGVTKLLRGNDYSQISGVREYQRGDKLSLINWKVSARKNSLMSKEFYPFLNQEVHIVLDCYKNNYKEDYDPDFELAITVAASLANSLAKHEKGLVMNFNNRFKDIINYKNNSNFVSRVMEKLAYVEADGTKPLEIFLNNNYFNENAGVTLLIVTNKISQNILNKMYFGTGKVKAKIYLVGENSRFEGMEKYRFVQHVKSLGELESNSKGRRTAK